MVNIDWDEGVEVGGPHAPYRQSQRHEIYRGVLDKLIAAGAVYESYSTAEEIDARNEANGRAKQLGYDNYDRDLTDEQKAAFRAEGREPAWRVRVPDEDLTFVDLIRGEVTFPRARSRLRDRSRRRHPALHLREPGRRRAHGDHPRHPRGGPHAVHGPSARVYRALLDAGVTDYLPRFGHMPLVLGETGNKKLQARPAGRPVPAAREGSSTRGC